jgi:cystathionine beta-lyase
VRAFVDALDLFEIGYSWAGITSLAVTYNLNHTRGASSYGDRLVRLSIGMEDTGDLIADLKQALERIETAQ